MKFCTGKTVGLFVLIGVGIFILSSSFASAAPAKVAQVQVCAAFTKPLVLGTMDRKANGDVVTLQKLLKVKPTGTFGPATKAAVATFQKKNALMKSGAVGPATRVALNTQFPCTPTSVATKAKSSGPLTSAAPAAVVSAIANTGSASVVSNSGGGTSSVNTSFTPTNATVSLSIKKSTTSMTVKAGDLLDVSFNATRYAGYYVSLSQGFIAYHKLYNGTGTVVIDDGKNGTFEVTSASTTQVPSIVDWTWKRRAPSIPGQYRIVYSVTCAHDGACAEGYNYNSPVIDQAVALTVLPVQPALLTISTSSAAKGSHVEVTTQGLAAYPPTSFQVMLVNQGVSEATTTVAATWSNVNETLSFDIPLAMNSGNYNVLAHSLENEVASYTPDALSLTVTNFVTPPASITVRNPKLDSNMLIGQAPNLSWKGEGLILKPNVAPIDIYELSFVNQSSEAIEYPITIQPNSWFQGGFHGWASATSSFYLSYVLPDSLPVGQYVMKVKCKGCITETQVTGQSSAFNVLPRSLTPSIKNVKIVSDKDTDTLTQGEGVRVTWETENIAANKIMDLVLYNVNLGQAIYLALDNPQSHNDGLFTATIPLNAPLGSYNLQIGCRNCQAESGINPYVWAPGFVRVVAAPEVETVQVEEFPPEDVI